MCLTRQVRNTLVKTDTCDTSKLVEEAENRHNAYLAATHIIPSTLYTSDITAVSHYSTLPAQQHRLLKPEYVGIIYVVATKLKV